MLRPLVTLQNLKVGRTVTFRFVFPSTLDSGRLRSNIPCSPETSRNDTFCIFPSFRGETGISHFLHFLEVLRKTWTRAKSLCIVVSKNVRKVSE